MSHKTLLHLLILPDVQTISEHTTKVRSVFRNPEIKRLNGQQTNQQPIQCKIQNPGLLLAPHNIYA